jgi:hypothetical protein
VLPLIIRGDVYLSASSFGSLNGAILSLFHKPLSFSLFHLLLLLLLLVSTKILFEQELTYSCSEECVLSACIFNSRVPPIAQPGRGLEMRSSCTSPRVLINQPPIIEALIDITLMVLSSELNVRQGLYLAWSDSGTTTS